MEIENLKQQLMSKKLEESGDNIKLTKKQNDAFNMMVKGESVFITGPGGVGKTSLIKLFVRIYKQNKIIGLTSTTGISALLFGGSTLHSYLGIGLGQGSVDYMSQNVFKNSKLRKRWNDLETLIIDEVSMLSPVLFDKIEQVARCVRRNEKPFGGIQLVLSGDFLQLPCVGSDDFCFEAKSWNKCITHTIYLTEIIRQSNEVFQKCLNNIRIGNITKDIKKLLSSRVNIELRNDFGIKPTKLYPTNASVDIINQKELDKLAENDGIEFFEYEMETTVYPNVKNKDYILEKYKKLCNAPALLELCKGAQVMLLYNMDVDGGLANGSRGVVTGFIDDIPLIKFMNGRELIIDWHSWDIEEGDQKVLKMNQIPLKLAWCISQHKAQGMSLDLAEIDLSNCFEYGQAYVALSRVKTIEGLSIINDIDFDKVIAHPKAIQYYEENITSQDKE